jgi:hypothetical protein
MLANLAPNLSQLRKLRSRAIQQDSDSHSAFQEASTYACRLQHFQAMLFRCIECLKETWLVYVPPGSKQKILDSVHKFTVNFLSFSRKNKMRGSRSEGHIRDPRNTRMGKRAEGREGGRRLLRKTRAPNGM